MSKENDFHILIEQQNVEEKELFWNNIKAHQEETLVVVDFSSKKKHCTIKKVIPICSSILFVALIGIVASIGLFSEKNKEQFRYCSHGDYYTIDSDYTLQDYFQQYENILYFNWVNESEYCYDFEYRLISTDEVICFAEELIDLNDVTITLYVTDDKTKIDFLDYDNFCTNITVINNVQIMYGANTVGSQCFFNYKGYIYYLNTDSTEDSYIVSLCQQLLSQ